jgi:hypothetical protein
LFGILLKISFHLFLREDDSRGANRFVLASFSTLTLYPEPKHTKMPLSISPCFSLLQHTNPNPGSSRSQSSLHPKANFFISIFLDFSLYFPWGPSSQPHPCDQLHQPIPFSALFYSRPLCLLIGPVGILFHSFIHSKPSILHKSSCFLCFSDFFLLRRKKARPLHHRIRHPPSSTKKKCPQLIMARQWVVELWPNMWMWMP